MAEEKVKAAVEKIVPTRISGTFYRRPAPDLDPYIEVGSVVKKGQVLALLETMKVFQKVKSPVVGQITEIMAENEQVVAEGDPLFKIAV
jgi:biotin carboxyl carrier protein